MQVVYEFKFESNALYASEVLLSNGINSSISKSKKSSLFLVSVDKDNSVIAEKVIKGMDLDKSELDPNSDGYIARYNEWTENMYNPGNYTGGKFHTFI